MDKNQKVAFGFPNGAEQFNTDGNGESLPHGIVNGSGHGASGIVIIRYVDESV